MCLVMVIGGHAVIKSPPARAEAFNNAVLHQQVKNAVDGYPIDRVAPVQYFVDIACGKGKSIVSNDFQNAYPIRCRL